MASASPYIFRPLQMASASPSILRPLLLATTPSPKRLDLFSRFLSPSPFPHLRRSPLALRSKSASSRSTGRIGAVKAAQPNFLKVIQTAWRIGKDSVEAGTNLVPDSIPRPIARIGITTALVGLSLFLLNSFLATAFFVLALMVLIYFLFIVFNTDEGPRGGGGDPLSEEETLEEARKIMEKYK